MAIQETSPQHRRQGLGRFFADRQRRAQQEQEHAEQPDDQEQQGPEKNHGPFHLTRKEAFIAGLGSLAALAASVITYKMNQSTGLNAMEPARPSRPPVAEKKVNTETAYSMFSKRLKKDTDPEFWAQVAREKINPLGIYNFNIQGGGVRRRNIYLEKKDLENDRVSIRIRVDGDGSFFANDAIAAKHPTVEELKELAKKILLNPPDDSAWNVEYKMHAKQNTLLPQIVGITTHGNTTTVFKIDSDFLLELEEKQAPPILIAQSGENG